jgi:hypothetical protein
MNLKIKSTLIIIGTFIIGLIVGIIVTKSFFHPPGVIDKIAELKSPRGFMERFERIIEPTQSQRSKIRKILRDHFEKVHEQSRQFRGRFMQLNDSLRTELDPILTDEQKERLDEMEKRFREHERGGFGMRPPHPKRKFPKEKKDN